MTTPLTTFSGIASGIDSAALIDSLLKVAKAPISRLQTKQAANASMSGKFQDLKSKLSALQDAAQNLDTASEVKVTQAASSSETVLKAQATGGAAPGTFSIQVSSVAQAERTYSDPVSASDQSGLFGSGMLTIQVGSDTAVDIEVNPEDSLSAVAGKINASEAKVTANIVFDGSSYRLQVSGTETGASRGITFTETSQLTLGLSDPANQFQAATSAAFTVDDIPITSDTNIVTSAIPGVTLTLTGTGTAEVTVEADPEGLREKIDTFVTAYNGVMNMMNAEFTYTGSKKAADSLSGDSTLRGIQSELRKLMSQSLSDLTSSFGSVGSLGITLANDGTLSVDAAQLSEAVAEDYEGVVAALAGSGNSSGVMQQVSDAVDRYVDAEGAVSLRISNLATRNKQIDKQISGMQLRMDKYEEQLRMEFAALESLIGGLQAQGNAIGAMIQSLSSQQQ